MVVDVLKLDDAVSAGDDDGKALVECLAAAPSGVTAATRIMPHETELVHHENWPTTYLGEYSIVP